MTRGFGAFSVLDIYRIIYSRGWGEGVVKQGRVDAMATEASADLLPFISERFNPRPLRS